MSVTRHIYTVLFIFLFILNETPCATSKTKLKKKHSKSKYFIDQMIYFNNESMRYQQ